MFNRLHESLRVKFLILLVTTVIIVALLPRGEALESEVGVGTIWLQEDLIAEVTFPILKNPEVLKKEIEEKKKAIAPIFQLDESVQQAAIDSLNHFHAYLKSYIDGQFPKTGMNTENPSFLSSEAFHWLMKLRAEKRRNNGVTYDGVAEKAVLLINKAYQVGVIQLPSKVKFRDSIAVRSKNIDILQPRAKYITAQSKNAFLEKTAAEIGIPVALRKLVADYSAYFLFPNLLYQEQHTAEEQKLAEKRVTKYIGIVTENERIISKHDRVTPEVKQKIDSYRIAKGEAIGWEGILLQSFGKFLHILSLLLLLGIYIFLFRQGVFNSNSKLLVFAILLLGICLLSYLVTISNMSESGRFLIFIPAASMLITIMFDSRLGFYTTIIYSLICGGVQGNDYSFVVMNLVSGVFAVYTVRDIKNRTQIFRSFIFIFLGYIITIFAFGFERFDPMKKIFTELMFAGTNALVSPVLTFGLLIFFERIFRITTDLTLLELSNSDSPLLRDLAQKAPGTFNHSLALGSLVETTAIAIKANPLLAKVGAYYHDIGKTMSPKAFVENQAESLNIHDEITPEESVRIIREHVEMGVEIARKNNIPQEIIDFIPSHHGTTIINFFYNKAIRMYGESKVSVADFRYAGPKPRTKETAIVMLADTCESAFRSMDAPEPEKVENLVRKLIESRIADGQLDEAPITYKDLDIIRKTFISVLISQSYRRIKYPNQDKLERAD